MPNQAVAPIEARSILTAASIDNSISTKVRKLAAEGNYENQPQPKHRF